MWKTLIDLALPLTCPGCAAPEPWCGSCAGLLAHRPRRVVPPMAESEFIGGSERVGVAGDLDCQFEADAGLSGLPPAYALARYRGPVRAAILAAKERGRRDLPALLGAALGVGLFRMAAIGVVLGPLWLVPAPTRPAMARRRGGDPMTFMARAAASVLARAGLPVGVAPCLYTGRGARDSVGLDARARLENLSGRVRWRGGSSPPPGAPVVLLDDVLTTGATATSAAAALAGRGHPVQVILTLTAVPGLVAMGADLTKRDGGHTRRWYPPCEAGQDA